jgi:hypothetical protein
MVDYLIFIGIVSLIYELARLCNYLTWRGWGIYDKD